jgi:hypothetical protein
MQSELLDDLHMTHLLGRRWEDANLITIRGEEDVTRLIWYRGREGVDDE